MRGKLVVVRERSVEGSYTHIARTLEPLQGDFAGADARLEVLDPVRGEGFFGQPAQAGVRRRIDGEDADTREGGQLGPDLAAARLWRTVNLGAFGW